MTTPVIYTDPYTGYEVLVLEQDGKLFGAAYDPRRTALPIPWLQNCLHCVRGRQRDLTIHLKRQIQLLCTRKFGGYIPQHKAQVLEYRVPSNGHSHVLRHWTVNDCQHANILDDEQELLHASKIPLEKIVFEGNQRDFRSDIVHRCLRFLFSGRPALPTEIACCAQPLAEVQQIPKIRRGRRNLCDTLVWEKVLTVNLGQHASATRPHT